MYRLSLLILVLTYPAYSADTATINREVVAALNPVRDQYHLPALAAAIVTSKGLLASGVVGVRKAGTSVPATLNDEWHLGSNGKAMTAALIGCFIDQRKVTFDSRMDQIFPDLAGMMTPEFRAVTVEQLLRHRSGLPRNVDDWEKFAKIGALTQQRLAVVVDAGRAPLAPTSDLQRGYSNWGYVVLGAIAERVGGKPWEELVTDHIFRPLGMDSAGFGGLGTPRQIDQPWPHRAGVPEPMNGAAVDNPPVLGPAGTVHCQIGDWAKFIHSELLGFEGHPVLLTQATFKRLHDAGSSGVYAGGWIVMRSGWPGGVAYNHAGSNEMNYSDAWIAPGLDVAYLVCTNEGDMGKATEQAVGALHRVFQSIDQ